MCAPLVVGLVMVAAAAAMQAKAQSDQASYQAKVASNNAKIAGYQSENAARQGEMAQDKVNRETAATIGAQRAGFGASGISLGSGTPLDVELSTTRAGALDLATIAQNTALRQWGFGIEKQNALSQEDAFKATAANAPITGAINFGVSALSMASQSGFSFGGGGNPGGLGGSSSGSYMTDGGNIFGNIRQ